MKLGHSPLLGAIGSLLIATGAVAADLPPAPSPVAPAPSAPMAPPAFDWSGPYLGVSAGYLFCSMCTPALDLGLEVGYDRTRGRLLYGAGAEFSLWRDPGIYTSGEVDARLGLALDRALVYAEIGYLIFFNSSTRYFVVGGGAEFSLGANASVYAELDAHLASPFPLMWHVSVGLRWRLGS